jgi:hypothetical protein
MASRRKPDEIPVPSQHNWRTTDSDEINRRRIRAREEQARIENISPAHPIFSNFRVQSPSGMVYSVEIRDVAQRHFACTCVDFRINGLGTCKHVEGVLNHLHARFSRKLTQALKTGSDRIDIAYASDPAASPIPILNLVEKAAPADSALQ